MVSRGGAWGAAGEAGGNLVWGISCTGSLPLSPRDHGQRYMAPAAGSQYGGFQSPVIQASAVTENDTSAAAFVGLALWRLARIVRRRPIGLGEYAWAGLFVGLAILGKSSALIAPLLAAVGLVLAWWPDKSSTPLGAWLTRALTLFGVTLVVGGWWYAQNWWLYADPLRSSAYDHYPWMYPELRPIWALLPDAPRSLLSFWADLGYSGDIRPTAYSMSGLP